MSMSFLEALNKAGCIDKQITESDDRFDKVNAAAEKFANDMEPNLLIDGFHSLIKESFFETNVAMQSAYSTLKEYWINVGFIYPDEKPHRLLTAMVLYACVKLAEKNNSYASMLALNIVDIWPYLSVHNPHIILSKELVDEWNKKLNIYSYST
ncbi:hypothetical protein KN515_23205, partial [Acinetobacter baumannii]|nr:hypothetical protein [Acinetobacter baumannii]